jgi:uncharacterized protein YgiM (DUF1202 family)
MQRVTQFIIAIFVMAVLVGAGLGPKTVNAAPPAQSAPTATVLVDRLNVRSGPGTGYKVVASAKNGEKYTVIGQSGQCSWLKVSRSGKELGWISGGKSFVKLNTACSKIPAAAAPTASPAAAPSSTNTAQGCAQVINQLGFDVKISLARSDGWKDAFTVAKGAEKNYCVDPGSYTATVSATNGLGAMSFPVTVAGGENYRIPLAMPGQ